MTTIIYYEGVMMGDTQVSSGGAYCGTMQKVSKHIPNKNTQLLFGYSGPLRCKDLVEGYTLSYFRNPKNPGLTKPSFNKEDSFQALVAVKQKNPALITVYEVDSELDFYSYKAGFYAIGSGENYAKGAFSAILKESPCLLPVHTLKRTMNIVSFWDAGTGSEVTYETFE